MDMVRLFCQYHKDCGCEEGCVGEGLSFVSLFREIILSEISRDVLFSLHVTEYRAHQQRSY